MIQEDKPRFQVALLVGTGVMLLLVGGVFLLMQSPRFTGPAVELRLPLGPAEQAYAEHIHFLDVKMSRAANFLNQEVTFIFGVLSNDGARTIRQMEVTIEFRDLLNQVVLRETQRLFGERVPPLRGGQRREFQLTFEHVPADWNRQYPSIRVTGLVLD